ncbi:uncharacterized protein LOC132194586 [Neocloeon triangulifer]|uniref:uncharacterized protein LOC132194586 n=1 Tax=Neocloeon triangulifer TaxID=2078957 RepID=UPI00286F3612|nr:uncharacterized protein LOC132194586 [Neocloeon triangulifer]
MPLRIGNYGAALHPVFAFGALTAVFPASRATARAKFNTCVLAALAAFLFYGMYRFSRFFLAAWKDHDKRETSLNLTNVVILSSNFIAGLAIMYTCLLKADRFDLILKNIQRLSTFLNFDASAGHANLRRRVWIRSVSAFVIMNFLFVYEPFVWPDYFHLLDLIGRLWSSVAIAILEMQVICIADCLREIFCLLNARLVATKMSIRTLRKSHGDLCDTLHLFQEHYGVFIVANILYLFTSLTFGMYFSIVGIYQNLPDVEKIIKQAVVSDSWLCYAGYRLVQLVTLCSSSLKEARKTGIFIFRLNHPNIWQIEKKELLIFSRQIQHQPHKFYATGILALDNSLLFETFSAVATYFFIMVQFQNSL